MHRPIDELPGLVALARSIGARAVGFTPPSPQADQRGREITESAGLHYVSGLDIVDEVRRARKVADHRS
ncbi:MAG TPA: hypothetical protein VHF27_01500 [Acidimicrobiales bacterium]|nr:hypothetical protein [Acidimicrobiales bacterium]